jgi:hypothetical protein
MCHAEVPLQAINVLFNYVIVAPFVADRQFTFIFIFEDFVYYKYY